MCLYWQRQSIFTCINSWGLEKYDLSQGVNWTWKFSKKYCNIIDPQLNSALVIPVTDPYGNSSSLLHMCPSVLSQSCLTLCDPMDCSPPGSSVHADSPGKNTGVGCHALLQGIFPNQGSNLGLLYWGQILYHVSHQEAPICVQPFTKLTPVYSQWRIFISYFIEKVKPLGRNILMIFKWHHSSFILTLRKYPHSWSRLLLTESLDVHLYVTVLGIPHLDEH